MTNVVQFPLSVVLDEADAAADSAAKSAFNAARRSLSSSEVTIASAPEISRHTLPKVYTALGYALITGDWEETRRYIQRELQRDTIHLIK